MRHFLPLTLLLITFSASGQAVRDDSDSNACLNALSVMSEFAKMGLHEEAWESWKYCFENCPSASRNIYITGPSILYDKIEKAADQKMKGGYIDTLMLLYDRRIQYFGQEGYVSARKGIDILKYRPTDYPEAYSLLKKSVSLEMMNTEPVSVAGYMQVTSVMFRNGKIPAPEAIANYFGLMDIIYSGNAINDAQKDSYASTISSIMAESGSISCETVNLYMSNMAVGINPSAIPFLLTLLEKSGCQDPALLSEIASLIDDDGYGDGSTALVLAGYFQNLKDYDNAALYYYKAIDSGQPDDKIPDIYYNLSVIELQRQNYQQSRSMALKALEYKPSMGAAFISIGLAYAASAEECGQNEFEKGAVYWAAVDKFIQARETDPGVSQRADELISIYSKYFPGNEVLFFSGHTEGEEYTVGCWINETTVVRH